MRYYQVFIPSRTAFSASHITLLKGTLFYSNHSLADLLEAAGSVHAIGIIAKVPISTTPIGQCSVS